MSRGSSASPWLAATLMLFGSVSVHAANTDLRTIRTNVYRAIASDPNLIALSGYRCVPPSGSPSSGNAVLTGNNPLTQLGYNLTHNVPGETSATIRGPGYTWENAPVLHNLPLGTHKIGSWSFGPTQRDYILAGRTYIEIRSASFPSGAIRAQIVATNPPVGGRGLWVRVLVENLGPDTYVPGGEFKPGRPGTADTGDLKISVDIDEPTKPGFGRPGGVFNVQKEFDITIAPFDTVEVDLGVVTGYTPAPGELSTSTTSIAQLPNVDVVPANNMMTNEFNVLSDQAVPVPSTGGRVLLVTAGTLGALGVWRAAGRRRRTDSNCDSGGHT